MMTLDAQGFDATGNWYSALARRAMGLPNDNGEIVVSGFVVNAAAHDEGHTCTCGCTPSRTTDTIRNGFLVRKDGNPISGPVMIRGGRPVVVSATEPAYLKGQAIADAAVAGQQRSAAANAANQSFWAKGARA